MPPETVPSTSVVVTGASTGIGRATVAQLVTEGFHVWGAVRNEKDAASLTAEHGDAVTPLLLDLLDHDSVRAAGARVAAAGPLHGLVNNAGVALPAPLEFMPIDAFERQLDINVVGQLLMTQVLLPALIEGKGRITFVGSISGRIAGPMLGAYSASKHAIVGLASALRAELAPYRVRVCLVEPGVIATPIWQTAAGAGAELLQAIPPGTTRYQAQIEAMRGSAANTTRGLHPRAVAAAIAKTMTMRNPKPRQTIGSDARLGAAAVRLLPFRAIYRITAARH